MFYATVSYQFKSSELKNVEKLVEQTVQALKLAWTGNVCIYVQIRDLHSWVGSPWKWNVVREKSLKMRYSNFLHESWFCIVCSSLPLAQFKSTEMCIIIIIIIVIIITIIFINKKMIV